MSRQKKTYVGKIGYCDNKNLGLTDKYGKPLNGGHYVYIREMRGNRCDVNIITSLERTRKYRNGSIVKDRFGEPVTDYTLPKIDKVKKGYLYPIPKKDGNFTEWSAVNLDGNIKGVKLSAIKNIGYKKIKTRHKWFVGKFTKK